MFGFKRKKYGIIVFPLEKICSVCLVSNVKNCKIVRILKFSISGLKLQENQIIFFPLKKSTKSTVCSVCSACSVCLIFY